MSADPRVMVVAQAIIERHRSDEHRLCYAQSLGPVTALHQFSNRVEAKVLHCTRLLGHEGKHQDSGCCYNFHEFGMDMATKPQPESRNLERCVECRREWPCDVALLAYDETALRERIAAEIEEWCVDHGHGGAQRTRPCPPCRDAARISRGTP